MPCSDGEVDLDGDNDDDDCCMVLEKNGKATKKKMMHPNSKNSTEEKSKTISVPNNPKKIMWLEASSDDSDNGNNQKPSSQQQQSEKCIKNKLISTVVCSSKPFKSYNNCGATIVGRAVKCIRNSKNDDYSISSNDSIGCDGILKNDNRRTKKNDPSCNNYESVEEIRIPDDDLSSSSSTSSSLSDLRKALSTKPPKVMSSSLLLVPSPPPLTKKTATKTTASCKVPNNTTMTSAAAVNTRRKREQIREEEKENKKRIKILEREQRQAIACAVKENKKRTKAELAQISGKLAKDEIGILMERRLYRHDQLGMLTTDLTTAGYVHVHEYPSALGMNCNAIQWIRKDSLQGGAKSAIDALSDSHRVHEYQHITSLVVIVDDPMQFISMLQQKKRYSNDETTNVDDDDIEVGEPSDDDDNDDNYPELESWIFGIEYGWRAAWKANLEYSLSHKQQRRPEQQRPRIILFLYNVIAAFDRMWIDYRKKGKPKKSRTATTASSTPPPTAEELHDAITWMLIQFQVECVHCNTYEDLSHNIIKMTRILSEQPYRKQITELECIRKIKPSCSDYDTDYDRSKDCWIRQLQQIPRVSYNVAMNLVCYYPTALSLYNAYEQIHQQQEQQKQNTSRQQQDVDGTTTTTNNEEARFLLSNCLSSSSGARQSNKLSEWIYRVMTSDDPNEILH